MFDEKHSIELLLLFRVLILLISEIWNIHAKKAANVLSMYQDEINVKHAVLRNVLQLICDQKVSFLLLL